MCFAAPARVVALIPGGAEVERGAARFAVTLFLLDEPVAVGDWVGVQAQRHAVARLSETEAAELFALYETIGACLDPEGAEDVADLPKALTGAAA